MALCFCSMSLGEAGPSCRWTNHSWEGKRRNAGGESENSFENWCSAGWVGQWRGWWTQTHSYLVVHCMSLWDASFISRWATSCGKAPIGRLFRCLTFSVPKRSNCITERLCLYFAALTRPLSPRRSILIRTQAPLLSRFTELNASSRLWIKLGPSSRTSRITRFNASIVQKLFSHYSNSSWE